MLGGVVNYDDEAVRILDDEVREKDWGDYVEEAML